MELKTIAHIETEQNNESNLVFSAKIIIENSIRTSVSVSHFELPGQILITHGLNSAENNISALNQLGHTVFNLDAVLNDNDSLILQGTVGEQFANIPVYDIIPFSPLKFPVTSAQASIESSAANIPSSTNPPGPETQDTKIPAIPDPPKTAAAENSQSTLVIPLTLGVIFVIIAGIAFISANSDDLSQNTLIFIILMIAATFYTAFAISHFKLRLSTASKAFYLLGSTAAAIDLLAIEAQFIQTDIDSALLILPCATLFAASVLGYFKLYRSTAFVLFAWFSGYCTLSATLYAIYDYNRDALYDIISHAGSLPWLCMTLLSAAAVIFISLTNRPLSRLTRVCCFLALAFSTLFLIIERSWSLNISSPAFYVITAALALLHRKTPGTLLMLSIWFMGFFIALDLEDLSVIPSEPAILTASVIPAVLSYLMPVLGKQFTPSVHNKVYWVTLTGLCIFALITLLMTDNEYLVIFYLIPAAASLIFGIKYHSTRYVTAFAILGFVIGLILFNDALDEISWWIYMLIIGSILIALAIINEIKHRQGESLIQKLKGTENSLWKW